MLKEIKYLIFVIIIILFLFFTGKYYFSNENIKKSYRSYKNNDEIINIQDIIIMIDSILENEYIFYGDLNEDEILNIQDIILMLDIILTD